MPSKRYPNGTVIYSYLNKYEMASYSARHKNASAAIPTAASLKKVRDISIRPDAPEGSETPDQPRPTSSR